MAKTRRPERPVRHRVSRLVAAALLTVGLSGAAGCGFDAQTLQPYTPAEGTNLDVTGPDNTVPLKVRNLVLISRAAGEGIVSASLLSAADDQLTGVSVTPSTIDGTPGTAVTASFSPVSLPARELVVLTDQPLITFTGATSMVAGGSAQVTMTFAQAGQVQLNTVVVDGDVAPWTAVTPSPTPTPSTTG